MVTGSRGFLGKSVVSHLEESSHTIVHYDIQDGDDILDSSILKAKLVNVDLCIHLAAVADLYDAEADEENCHLINVIGTRTVATCCAEKGVRLLFISTVCAYGNNGCAIQTEDSPLMPTEIYAETKALAETIIENVSGLDYRIVRPATFYGPGMRDSLVIQRFINASKHGHLIEIHGSGEQTRCYTHVDDVTASILIIAEAWPDDVKFNVANPRPKSVNQLVGMIERVSGQRLDFVHVEDRNGQIYCSAIDVGRLEKLGWAPKYTLEAGISQLMGRESEPYTCLQ